MDAYVLDSKFFDKVEKTDTCWLWFGCRMRSGYGKLGRKGKTLLAHRYSYELLKGVIPKGLTIDHLCRVRNCVNPDHLEAVTIGVNTLRGSSVSALAARKTHCPSGHEYSGASLRITKEGHRKCLICTRLRDRKRRLRGNRKGLSRLAVSG